MPPSPLQALQPTLTEPTFSATPPPQHTHTHYLVSAEPQTSRFICLFSRRRGGKEKKRNSTYHRTHASQGRGKGRRRRRQRRRRKDSIKCSSVQHCLQCWEAVSPRGLTTFYINLVQLKLKQVYFAHQKAGC